MPDLDLARRAVACTRWQWMPGMRARFEDWDAPVRVIACDERQAWIVHENAAMPLAFVCDLDSLHMPDFDDDATKGCLLALVRRAWGCDAHRRLTIETAGAGWCVIVRNGRHRPPSRARPGWDLDRVAHPPYLNSPRVLLDEYPAEAAALVAALERAP